MMKPSPVVLSAPPRRVPAGLQLKAGLIQPLSQLGWALAALGLALPWAAPGWAGFSAGPLIAGLLLVLYGLRQGARLTRLLRLGHYAPGALITQNDSGLRIGHRARYQTVWRFVTAAGQPQTVRVKELKELAGGEPGAAGEVGVLYNPARATENLVLEHHPLQPRFNAAGEWRTPGLGELALWLVLPAAAVVALSVYSLALLT